MTTAFLIFSLYWKLYAPLYLGVVILLILLLLKKSKRINLALPTDAPTIAFFCSSFLSWIENQNREVTAALLVSVIGFAALSWASRSSQRERETALLIAIAIPIIEMMGRILGRASGYGWLLWLEPAAPWLAPGFYGWRPLSLAGDWMDYSIWILIVLPVALRRGYWWYVVPSLIILIMGGSRSALIALAIIFIGEWMIKRVPRRMIMGYAFLSFILFSIFFLSGMNYGDRERIAGDGTTFSTLTTSNGRIDMWRLAYDQWRSAPWLGMGGGSYHFRSSGYESDHPHNQILWVLSEYGVVGLAVGLWWLWRAKRYYEPHVMIALALYSMLNVVGGVTTLTVLAVAANPQQQRR